VPGRAASAALLLGPRKRVSLPPAAQHLAGDGSFAYRGGEAPLPAPFRERARELAAAAVAAVPGLRGYVGVDLVLGDAKDGSGDRVIEVNPRLTTSYVGLRALAAGNLAGAMLDVARGSEVSPGWREGPVRWRADGVVTAE
jgi:tyramine---L-glutamate ligase